MSTGIPYVDESWSPVVGCSHRTEGCRHCWAELMATRLKAIGIEPFASVIDGNRWNGKVKLTSRLLSPLRWKKPRRVLVSAMGDLFHENASEDDQRAVFEVMLQAPQHLYAILTKRPDVMRSRLQELESIPSNWWFGVSAHDQSSADEALQELRLLRGMQPQQPPHTWLSLEPLLGPVELHELDADVELVVVGGESGPDRRPMKIGWATGIALACQQRGIPFYGKQVSGLRPGASLLIGGREVKQLPPAWMSLEDAA